jgi:hypothetical protein
MSDATGSSAPVPEPLGHDIPELEDDQTVAPRPEESIADVARQVPDTTDHAELEPGD